VLVGSVAGQRYWSSMLSLESTITCGLWTPDDQQVYFGTTSGRLIVMDVHGAMVSQIQLCRDHGPITSMAWSCEKFKMEESEADVSNQHFHQSNTFLLHDFKITLNVCVCFVGANRAFVLAVSLKNGIILLMKSFDDVSPVQLQTGLVDTCMEWSNSRHLLAVAGTKPCPMPSEGHFNNVLLFYSENGTLVYTVGIPYAQVGASTGIFISNF